jgi:hypothetical protein
MSLHHLTIRARLSVGFAIVLVLLLAVAVTSLTHDEDFMKYAEHGDYSTAKDVLLKSAMPAQAGRGLYEETRR